jgi:Xaa-Pro aminopeptidase
VRAEARRRKRLRAALETLGAASFLVTNPVNVRYLSGFESSNAALLVGADRVLVVTDGRYVEAAGDVEGVEVVESARELLPFLGARLGELAEPPVAFEAAHVTYAAHEALAASEVELHPVEHAVEDLRALKDEGELEAIRRAARVTHAVFERVAGEQVVGATEAELAWRLVQMLHDEGADEPAFPVIVAAGENAARPHHHPGPARIAAGETVIVDLGAKLGGYCSDCTRTFATGPGLEAELERAYELCREAQAEALAAVRPGSSATEVDAIARRRIEAEGHAVLHGLGHGVGLEVHEVPRLADTSDATLAAGNVVTVEPGVYVPGAGGVRIEDLVVVAEDGPEVLTPFSKQLTALA